MTFSPTYAWQWVGVHSAVLWVLPCLPFFLYLPFILRGWSSEVALAEPRSTDGLGVQKPAWGSGSLPGPPKAWPRVSWEISAPAAQVWPGHPAVFLSFLSSWEVAAGCPRGLEQEVGGIGLPAQISWVAKWSLVCRSIGIIVGDEGTSLLSRMGHLARAYRLWLYGP